MAHLVAFCWPAHWQPARLECGCLVAGAPVVVVIRSTLFTCGALSLHRIQVNSLIYIYL